MVAKDYHRQPDEESAFGSVGNAERKIPYQTNRSICTKAYIGHYAGLPYFRRFDYWGLLLHYL